jgi:hypothetical protein
MTKDEALTIAMKEYAKTHYSSECKEFAKAFEAGYEAGYEAASVGLSLSYLAERHFCPRCGKRLMSALGPVSIHTCCPPNGRTFDDYGNKIV